MTRRQAEKVARGTMRYVAALEAIRDAQAEHIKQLQEELARRNRYEQSQAKAAGL